MFDVTTIGDATLDTFLILEEGAASCSINKDTKHLCLHYGDKIPIVQSAQSIGGNAANVAVGLSRLGCHVAIVTDLGDDPNGTSIKNELKEHKVDVSHVRLLKNHDTRYSVVLNYEAERTVLSAHVDRSYTLPALKKTKWIYYTSLGKSFEKLQKQLITYLKKNPNVQVAMNPGSYQCKQGFKEIKKMLPHVNLLFVNKEEAELLSGEKKSIKATISALHTYGIETVVLTDGGNGATVSDGLSVYHMHIYPIRPIAKTGAGDAFASGFLAATIRGKSIPEAMQWGTANAGNVILKIGAQHGLANQTTVKNTIRKYRNVTPRKIS